MLCPVRPFYYARCDKELPILFDNIIIVSAAKGIENDTLMLMSDIFSKRRFPEPLHKNPPFSQARVLQRRLKDAYCGCPCSL